MSETSKTSISITIFSEINKSNSFSIDFCFNERSKILEVA